MINKIKCIRIIAILGIVLATMLVATPVFADTSVTVKGTVQSVLPNCNEFVIIITDSTDSTLSGNITVDAGPKWFKDLNLSGVLAVDDEVTVTGELDTGKDSTAVAHIDAFSITHDNTTYTVKGPGKPAWAGAKAAGNPGKNGAK
jgi:hypothetical protein